VFPARRRPGALPPFPRNDLVLHTEGYGFNWWELTRASARAKRPFVGQFAAKLSQIRTSLTARPPAVRYVPLFASQRTSCVELKKRLTHFVEAARNLVPTPDSPSLLSGPLLKLGLSKPFSPTSAAVKVYAAVIADKVASIDRLPSKYRKEAQQVIWASVMKGYDAAGMARELHERLGIVSERAQLIARIQCKMARVVIDNAERIEAGIKEAVWNYESAHCSIAGHRAFSERRYSLVQGAILDGKRIWPGSEPDCHCTGTPIDAKESIEDEYD
jgi:hypothetical protein